jgi:hypothetical protein
MQRMILILVVFCAVATSSAQNVGIGTSSPHASAALQVTSTTRGFLPPRMTTIQRLAIAGPLNGLIVYDTDLERQYTYIDGVWRYAITNELWANSSTAIYSSASMNVGIGTAAPQEKLHVSGNLRITGNLLSSGEFHINNSDGIINFQNASVDKAFVQLNNDNLRVGTYSTNSTGQFIVRLGGSDRLVVENGGNVGINNTNPQQRLDVGGNINLTGEVRHSETGSANMLAVAYGVITGSGTLHSGTGNFTITKSSTGVYSLTSSAFSASTVVIATPAAVNIQVGAGVGPSSNELLIFVRNSDTGTLTDAFFNFVAYTF